MVEFVSRQTVELATTFRLLGDVTRLRIVLACSEGAVCVGDIAAKLGQSPSLVSHHLRLLRGQRLVRAERRGKQIFYCLADAHVENVIADMRQHIDEAIAEFRAA